MGVPHLLVALLDQEDAEAIRALEQAGIDRAAVRRVALTELGASIDFAVIAMRALTPPGTLDRPTLPATQLDPHAWSILTWRQQHLPLNRVRRHGRPRH
jgi:ClpA/ClpB-like protein